MSTEFGRMWMKAVDTSQPSPLDVPDAGHELPVVGNVHKVEGRSVVVLVNHGQK
jgi:hypothetical protein